VSKSGTRHVELGTRRTVLWRKYHDPLNELLLRDLAAPIGVQVDEEFLNATVLRVDRDGFEEGNRRVKLGVIRTPALEPLAGPEVHPLIAINASISIRIGFCTHYFPEFAPPL